MASAPKKGEGENTGGCPPSQKDIADGLWHRIGDLFLLGIALASMLKFANVRGCWKP